MAKKRTVLITGASGYISGHLQQKLRTRGYNVRTLTTNLLNSNVEDCFYWNPETEDINRKALESVDYIIHLAGTNIASGRWTKKRKHQILDSRVNAAKFLFDKVHLYKVPLKAFISASATGYYGTVTSDAVFDEKAPAAHDFLGNVCFQWESAADRFQELGIRTVKIRTGVVLSNDAPALKKILLPIKLGLGSPLGSGKQYMPWIHIDDLCEIYLKAIEDNTFTGAYNAVAPQHITNREMMKTLSKILKKPFWFPAVPEFVLRIMFGKMSDLLLKGSRVEPKKLMEAGFEYRFMEVGQILL
ncbi:MAG: TIGR01777 family oxidoreductase [Paludibacter sp.]|nr:TIGR01777 family oxidoreductase [Paludibacter sp.]MDD4199328.1 TIGR01777 family oxidoreductase [Paludibacter sp.]MDD4427566.1 TIGR01777 family oxidoreductase [Paludibacter sp.]